MLKRGDGASRWALALPSNKHADLVSSGRHGGDISSISTLQQQQQRQHVLPAACKPWFEPIGMRSSFKMLQSKQTPVTASDLLTYHETTSKALGFTVLVKLGFTMLVKPGFTMCMKSGFTMLAKLGFTILVMVEVRGCHAREVRS